MPLSITWVWTCTLHSSIRASFCSLEISSLYLKTDKMDNSDQCWITKSVLFNSQRFQWLQSNWSHLLTKTEIKIITVGLHRRKSPHLLRWSAARTSAVFERQLRGHIRLTRESFFMLLYLSVNGHQPLRIANWEHLPGLNGFGYVCLFPKDHKARNQN